MKLRQLSGEHLGKKLVFIHRDGDQERRTFYNFAITEIVHRPDRTIITFAWSYDHLIFGESLEAVAVNEASFLGDEEIEIA